MTPSKRRRAAGVALRGLEPVASTLRVLRTLLSIGAEHHGPTPDERWAALLAIGTMRARLDALEKRVMWLECDEGRR